MRDIWGTEASYMNPMLVFEEVQEEPDILQGLIPMESVVWMYGPSMSFKSFVAMSIAAAVADGKPWVERETEKSSVIYIGAEGGSALHFRRAASELNIGGSGKRLAIVQERPQLDTPEGKAALVGIIQGMTHMSPVEDLLEGSEMREVFGSPAFVEMFNKYNLPEQTGRNLREVLDMSMLVIIDTYSQTSSGDDKVSVSAYMKALRDIITWARDSTSRVSISFLVVDHVTKSGGSYLGSVAKLNDVESQLEVVRDRGTMRTALHQHKSKDGREQAPILLELKAFGFEGMLDAYGDPRTTLVVDDGRHAAVLAAIADGRNGALLRMVVDGGGSVAEKELRKLFSTLPEFENVKPDSASKAFKRAKDDLVDEGLLVETNGVLSTSVL